MHNAQMNDILSFIHENYNRKITADIIAKNAGISRSECFKLFRHALNKSITAYINEYRLERAARLLRENNGNIIEISAQSGFESVSYFGKLFKTAYNMTPLEYKKTQFRTGVFRENIGGYDYEYWKNSGNGTMTITGNADNGSFSCEWDKIDCIVFRGGKRFDSLGLAPAGIGNITLKYNADFKPYGTAHLSVYGWMTEPLIEWLIIESFSTYKPPGSGTFLGKLEVDGGVYEITREKRKNRPSIISDNDEFEQYWSVRDWGNNRTSGTVSVSEHFRAWEKLGLPMGKLYEVALSIEGWLSSGIAVISENIVTTEP